MKNEVHQLNVSPRELTERRAVFRDHKYTLRPSTRRVFSEPVDAIEIRMGTGVTAARVLETQAVVRPGLGPLMTLPLLARSKVCVAV